jgi:hypothetical protein
MHGATHIRIISNVHTFCKHKTTDSYCDSLVWELCHNTARWWFTILYFSGLVLSPVLRLYYSKILRLVSSNISAMKDEKLFLRSSLCVMVSKSCYNFPTSGRLNTENTLFNIITTNISEFVFQSLYWNKESLARYYVWWPASCFEDIKIHVSVLQTQSI